MNGHSIIPAPMGDDTIELQLTPEQFRDLSQAAELAEFVDSTRMSAVAASGRLFSGSTLPQLLQVSPARRARLWHQAPLAKTLGAIVAYAALAWWGASQLAGQPHAPAVFAASTAAVTRPIALPQPVLMASASEPAVRVVNPFDATEVFEFPPGTSHAEGREKVAQILLQRAQERRGQWERVKPVESVRTASLYPP